MIKFKKNNTEEDFRNKLFPKKLKVTTKVTENLVHLSLKCSNDKYRYFIFKWNKEEKVFHRNHVLWIKILLKSEKVNFKIERNKKFINEIIIESKEVDKNGFM